MPTVHKPTLGRHQPQLGPSRRARAAAPFANARQRAVEGRKFQLPREGLPRSPAKRPQSEVQRRRPLMANSHVPPRR
jgi:hypothetical protein